MRATLARGHDQRQHPALGPDAPSSGLAAAQPRLTRGVLLAVVVLLELLVFCVYVRTMAPTITWRNDGADSGDLVTAAINLGVPHPTGYPWYTWLAHWFAAWPGQDPARSVTLFSALAATGAVLAVFWAAYRLNRMPGGETPALAAAWAGAGLFAFGELLWSQATIAEVYALHAFLAAALLAVALSGHTRARPYVLAALLGLGLAHHLTIVLLLPALWPYGKAARRWLTWRRLLGIALCLLPGLLTYLYIPLRAGAYPLPNWGQADSPSGFLWLVSGAAYRQYLRILPPSAGLQRLLAWLGIWRRDLGILGLALALLGLWRGLETNRRFAYFALTYVLLLTTYSFLYATSDSYLYLLPAAEIMALWVAGGAAALWRALQTWAKPGRPRLLVTIAALLLLSALPLFSVVTRFQAMDTSSDREAYTFADNLLGAAAPDALIVSDGGAQTFSLWYLRYGLGKRPDVAVVDQNLLAFDWYRTDLARRLPELAALRDAYDAQEAAVMLVRAEASRRPIHLTGSSSLWLPLADWRQAGPFLTLARQ